MRGSSAAKLLRKAIAASIALHLCALAALAAWSLDRLVRSPRLGASPGVVVMEASFSEPAPPVSVVSFTPSRPQVLIMPDRAEALTRQFVQVPADRVPLEQFLSRDVLDQLLTGDEPPPAAAISARQQPEEQLAMAQPAGAQPNVERQNSKRQPATAQATAIVDAVKPTPPTEVGTRTGPSFAGNRPHTYPAIARRNGWEGQVMLRLTVSDTGDVIRVEVVRSSGFAILDAEAVATVRTWRGTPATLNGRPIETTELLPVRFRLK